MEISLEGLDQPHDYQLVGGPFDGSSVRMALEVLESPPMRIQFEWMPDSSRGRAKKSYILTNDKDGYRHEQPKPEKNAHEVSEKKEPQT